MGEAGWDPARRAKSIAFLGQEEEAVIRKTEAAIRKTEAAIRKTEAAKHRTEEETNEVEDTDSPKENNSILNRDKTVSEVDICRQVYTYNFFVYCLTFAGLIQSHSQI